MLYFFIIVFFVSKLVNIALITYVYIHFAGYWNDEGTGTSQFQYLGKNLGSQLNIWSIKHWPLNWHLALCIIHHLSFLDYLLLVFICEMKIFTSCVVNEVWNAMIRTTHKSFSQFANVIHNVLYWHLYLSIDI